MPESSAEWPHSGPFVRCHQKLPIFWPLRTLRARAPAYTEFRGMHPASTRALSTRQSSGRPAAAATVSSWVLKIASSQQCARVHFAVSPNTRVHGCDAHRRSVRGEGRRDDGRGASSDIHSSALWHVRESEAFRGADTQARAAQVHALAESKGRSPAARGWREAAYRVLL
jgi:hypothetical protein